MGLNKSRRIKNSTWGLAKAEDLKIDAFKRKQFKRTLGIKYPTNISNRKLYGKPMKSLFQ